MSKELGLEDAVHKWIWFLSTHDEREPVISEVRCADGFDGANRNCSLGRDTELVVDDVLSYNIYMAIGL